MRNFFTVLSFLMLISTVASAQYTISERANVTSKVDTIGISLPSAFDLDIKTKAYYDYVKRKRRLERNFFTTVNNIKITQYAYDNWDGGGDNYFHGTVSTRNQHVYIVDKFTIDTYLNAAYGLRQTDGDLVKAEDNFEINSDISYVLYKRWSYTFGINLKSQFTKSYPDMEDKSIYSSNFFAPANLKPYFGLTFTVAANKKITFAPISGNILMVFDDELSDKGAFGVEKEKHTKLSVGGYINWQWTQDIIKDDVLKYRGIVQSFCDYESAPNVSWESWLDFKIFKFFTLNLYVKFIFDDKIDLYKNKPDASGEPVATGSHLQIKESLGFGISYSFKNKVKPKYKIIK